MSDWLTHYRTNKNAVWIKAELTDGNNLYLDNFKSWASLADSLEKQRVFFKKLSLQFRSHEVELDVKNCEGIYLVRSVIGQFSGETKETITFGKVNGKDIQKTIYMSPELIAEETYIDTVANSFEEAIVYDKTSKD